MDEPDYTSVEAKLGHAVEHYQTVYREILAWAQSCKTYATLEHNPDYTQHAIRYHIEGPEADFQRWTLIIGDFINNLRAPLDHIIYAIAKFKTLKGAPADVDIERLAFVIVDGSKEWGDANNMKRIGIIEKKGVNILGPKVVEAIRGLQPFVRTHPQLPPLLAILRDFSNADKHRFLELANSAVIDWDVSLMGRPKTKLSIVAKSIKDNDIIGLIQTPEPQPNLTLERSHISTASIPLARAQRR